MCTSVVVCWVREHQHLWHIIVNYVKIFCTHKCEVKHREYGGGTFMAQMGGAVVAKWVTVFRRYA